MKNDIKLNERQSYKSMFLFLRRQYKKNKSDDIGSLLGDIKLNENGSTVDPAARDDWLDSIEKVTGNKNSSHLYTIEALESMKKFLNSYYSRTTSDDIAILLNNLKLNEANEIINPEIRNDWLEVVKQSLSSDSDILVTRKYKSSETLK